MTRGSLRLRLLAASAVSIALALFLAGIALVRIFQNEVEARVMGELQNHLLQLAGAVEVRADGTAEVSRELADPRFLQPFGGLYWQVKNQTVAQDMLVSKSLWDDTLKAPQAGAQRGIIFGPEQEQLIYLSRTITINEGSKPVELLLTAAIHADDVTRSVDSFRRPLIWSLSLIGLALMIAAWVQVSIGLSPLKALQTALGAIRSGGAARLDGSYPDEVAPLVSEFNGVLAAQEKSLERARARAGDLAHGLKTPLTVLSAIARDLKKSRRGKEADEIDGQADAMRRHVDRELARARLATGAANARAPLRDAVEKVLAAMRRSPRGSDITWRNDVSSDVTVPMDAQDLTELLGNLLDNARKWTRDAVAVTCVNGTLAVDDNGPGVHKDKRTQILLRGARLDEKAQGSGLGLAIVSDICDLYGFRIELARADAGGLSARIVMPPRSGRLPGMAGHDGQ